MIRAVFSILALVTVAVSGVAAEVNDVYPADIAAWTAAVKERQARDTVKMVAELQAAAAAGQSRYVIRPGHYRFGSGHGWLKNFQLNNARDFTIVADGVTFWIDATVRQDGVVFKACTGVTLKGLTVDCDPFSYSQGEIIGIDRTQRTLTVRLDSGFPPLEQWQAGGGMKAPFFDRQGNFVPTWLDYVASFSRTADRTYLIKLKNNYIFIYNDPIEPGYRMAFPDRSKRMAFNLLDSKQCSLEQITVYNAPQMAFTEHNGYGAHRYIGCKVIRRPGTRRLITCNADMFHSLKVQHGPTIENCDWGWSCDDLINIHGFFAYVVAMVAPDEFIVVQSYSPEDWRNESVELFHGRDMTRIGRARVVSMTEDNDPARKAAVLKLPAAVGAGRFLGGAFLYRVKVDRPVRLEPMDVIQSYRYCGSGSVIRNNFLHDTLARGILVRGENVTIANNRIVDTGHNAIQIMTDWYFMEGSTPRHIMIRNNEVLRCARSLHGRLEYNLHIAAINCITCHRNWTYASGAMPIEDIVIAGNRIIDSGAIGIAVGNTRGAKIVDNLIVNPWSLGVHPRIDEKLREAVGAIYLLESDRLTVRNNRIEKLGPGVKAVVRGCNLGANVVVE